MLRFIFRPTTADFRKWCREYVGYAFDITRIYEQGSGIVAKDDYLEAKKICRQYKVLVASLESNKRTLFENKIMKNKAVQFSDKEERTAFLNIFDNWQEICFPERKYKLKTITKEEVGNRIKQLREEAGLTRTTVADILGISEATLKAYENGQRMLRLDVAYLLAQVYEIDLDQLIG